MIGDRNGDGKEKYLKDKCDINTNGKDDAKSDSAGTINEDNKCKDIIEQNDQMNGNGNADARDEINSDRLSSRELVMAHSKKYTYILGRILGHGSFGVVSEAECVETGEKVAVKSVHQDPRYKNRELDIMSQLAHPNIVRLRDYYYTTEIVGKGETKKYLNAVMEFVPDTVYRVLRSYVKIGQNMPMLLVKLFGYQMCRALGYLHAMGICHRDIKPQNLLVDNKRNCLKLCDFGSAKKLVPGEGSVAYICSRFYRAPELMLGATSYTTAVDLWSIGCVFGELLLGRPLFAGETSLDQLVRIVQILGSPTPSQLASMGSPCTTVPIPNVAQKSWKTIFESHVPDEAIDLLSRLLRYEPAQRIHPFQALIHPFFDQLRAEFNAKENGIPFPDLFNFSAFEYNKMPDNVKAMFVCNEVSTSMDEISLHNR